MSINYNKNFFFYFQMFTDFFKLGSYKEGKTVPIVGCNWTNIKFEKQNIFKKDCAINITASEKRSSTKIKELEEIHSYVSISM